LQIEHDFGKLSSSLSSTVVELMSGSISTVSTLILALFDRADTKIQTQASKMALLFPQRAITPAADSRKEN
jgi:hypothetical protein